ncbi:tetratricopeptide repeat protein [Maritalea sp.]|uniref:tetratricopeptide repeat protein n=1 Tax=Maritalea sp. TaxID=2003361 RepID=UPI003EF9F0A1
MSDTDNVFREVDEELRNERMNKLWRRFGPYVIGVAAFIILLVAGNEAWRWWQTSSANQGADQFTAAIQSVESGDLDAGQAALGDVVETGSGQYPILAKFRLAALLAEEGKTNEAVAAYDELVTTSSDTRLRELASIFAAYLLIDAGDPAAVTQRVGEMQVDSHPMRNAAREAIGLAHYKAGNFVEARLLFDTIAADPLTPRDLGLRVSLYLGQLTAQGIGSTTEAASE